MRYSVLVMASMFYLCHLLVLYFVKYRLMIYRVITRRDFIKQINQVMNSSFVLNGRADYYPFLLFYTSNTYLLLQVIFAWE